MPKKKKKTEAAVCIVESLNFLDEDTRKEGEIISRTLTMSGKDSHYSYVRTTAELKAFMWEFGNSKFRYLHVSCHGNVDAFFVTTGEMTGKKFASILAPHVRGRRIFLSTCLATDSTFANALLPTSGCLSILGPVGEIDPDDAAIFWTAFYHLRFKHNPNSMKHSDVEKTAKLEVRITCRSLHGCSQDGF